MAHSTITITGQGVQDAQELNIQISIVATVSIDAKTARRQATVWLVSEVGNMLVSGTPQLVISQQTFWRVPALLTSPSVGTVGQVGNVDIDATSGEVLADQELRKQILNNVERLARSTPTPVS